MRPLRILDVLGLDSFTRSQLKNFRLVMLVSCNPLTKLKEDAEALSATHTLVRFAILDHFPGTYHLECAAVFLLRETGNRNIESV